MNWLTHIAAMACIAGSCALPAAGAQAGWTPLFNGKDLDGWYTFLQIHGRDSDPDGIVSVEDGMMHLYADTPEGATVAMGYIGTEQEYENYHLRLEYKWGTKKFAPRNHLPKDAGLYYHLFAEDAVWPKSLQFQIEEGGVGDLIALYGVQADTWIAPETADAEMPTFRHERDGGVPNVIGGTGIDYRKRAGMYELEGWNTVEVIVQGASATHILNGKRVNKCENIRFVDPDKGGASGPLTKGRIALEIEAAEIFYRNIEIRSLEEAPAPAILPNERIAVGTAAIDIAADDDMEIAGGIGPWKPKGQEGRLRATAVVMQRPGEGVYGIVSTDVLFLTRDLVDSALAEVEEKCGIPPDHVMVTATHTHSAPSTTKIHGYNADERFRANLRDAIVESLIQAHAGLTPDCTFAFERGAEYSVGENSRLLLADNTIFWTGPHDDAVRPTAPFDPDFPALAFLKPDGKLHGAFYGHSTHTIGTVSGMVRSPSFYGLAAQALEEETGGTIAFLEGASGSTHNLVLTPPEALKRIQEALKVTLDSVKPRPVQTVRAIRKHFKFKVRDFDEAVEAQKVESYCQKRIPSGAEYTIGVFKTMRDELYPQRGQERETYIQAIRIGDVVLVGMPAEVFTQFGIDVKRRSPFEHTYIAELANDWIGYLPDIEGFERGGYQTWTGLHSYCAPGTGERMVDEIIDLLKELAK